MNGIAADSELVSVTPLWQWGLIALDVVLGLLILLVLFLTTRRLVVQSRSKSETDAPAGA